ncbi:hypothetical protein ACFOLF_06200 [Paenibacillus sepulcri]|uniref:Nucleotide modification associated domain-containing protein n=1 Tax=Paenibacillus sepulcri TaxID=359917 RepID=A0ABS7BXE6_9BACL|nr:hypothetical protein [Paenibacillus sepulcri]
MKHLLIKYVQPEDINNHVDPNFTYLTYGDSGSRGAILRNKIEIGSYIFFHTSYNQKEYLTAYFYVEKLLTKEKNQAEIANLIADSKNDDVVIIGNREHSKILSYPLPFDKRIVIKLKSLNIDFGKVERGEQSELKTISDSTRTHRELSEEEVDWLISECSNRG